MHTLLGVGKLCCLILPAGDWDPPDTFTQCPLQGALPSVPAQGHHKQRDPTAMASLHRHI